MANVWVIVELAGCYTVGRWTVSLLCAVLLWILKKRSGLVTGSDRDGNSGRFGHFSGLIHDPLTGSSTKENDK